MTEGLPMFLRGLRRLDRMLRQGYVPLVFAPFVMWIAYAQGGEVGLIAVGGAVSAYMLILAFFGLSKSAPPARDLVTGFEFRSDFLLKTQTILDQCVRDTRCTAVFAIEIDDFGKFEDQQGQTFCDRLLETIADRMLISTRTGDVIARIGDSRLAVALSPVRRIDLELALQIAARLQSTLEEPISVNGTPVYVTVSIGFHTATHCDAISPESLLDAATTALVFAGRSGPSGIRAFSPGMQRVEIERNSLARDAERAFDAGEICAWFQPQLSTDTGQISGVEALARWIHPERGMIPPGDFLPALEQAGLMDRLNETVLSASLETLRGLDIEGVHVPAVGVNFSSSELRDPKLVERIKWDIDRHDLTPDRVSIEILETVVAGQPDDILMRNISALSRMGCHIDLDDFGTGHASITSLRQFPIQRLKIDRSFITKCDVDPEQQRMLMAILTMAEKLELETLAEGLETVGEHAIVAQLGVGHVQGFGIARPMPPDMLAEWSRAHTAKLSSTPEIGGAAYR